MRTLFVAAIAAACLAGPAFAQNSIPAEIGNHANGFDYQPTPNEVGPRERAAGLQAPPAQRKAAGRDLEQIDRDLLRDEGLSTKSVPNLNDGD